MADKETGLNIPISAYADEDSAKKAVQDLTKSVLGALKDGYIEIPTAISDEFDKSKASAKLIRAQKDFLNQWGKMSKEGFSSSEEDLQAFVDKFTEFKRLMGKEGKGGSKQNLAIRDLGLGELVQSYRRQINDIQSQVKNVTKTNRITRNTRRQSEDVRLPLSNQEMKRRLRGIESIGPKGLRSNTGFDTGVATSKTILDTERGGSYASNFEAQMARSRQESKKWEKESLRVTRLGKEEIEQAIKDALSRGNNKNNFTEEETSIEKRNVASDQLAKILGGIENNNPDATIKQFNDYLQGIFTFNNKAGKSDWEAISLSLNKTFNRYFNTKGTLGVTDGSPKGVGEGHSNAEVAIAGMFEKFKDVLEQNGLTAELDRVNKVLARIDPRLVETANSLSTISTNATGRQTVSSNSTLDKEIQELNRNQKTQIQKVETQTRLDIMENSAERIADSKEGQANERLYNVIERDAETGFNRDDKPDAAIAYLPDIYSTLSTLSGIKSPFKNGGSRW